MEHGPKTSRYSFFFKISVLASAEIGVDSAEMGGVSVEVDGVSAEVPFLYFLERFRPK